MIPGKTYRWLELKICLIKFRFLKSTKKIDKSLTKFVIVKYKTSSTINCHLSLKNSNRNWFGTKINDSLNPPIFADILSLWNQETQTYKMGNVFVNKQNFSWTMVLFRIKTNDGQTIWIVLQRNKELSLYKKRKKKLTI